MKLEEKKVQRIVRAVTKKFRSFGAGQDSDSNPVAHALKDTAPMFAAGVDIEEVVRFVLSRR